MFGSSDARPTYAGPTAGSASVELPRGTWERYHSEATEGYELVHVGSLEFAVRGGRLFHRAWNGERWQAASGDLAVYGSPTIIETSYGFVLVPAARGGLWTSRDGEAWNRLAGSDDVTIDQVATDGELVVGSTRVGDLDGPASELTVLDGAGRMRRLSLPLALAGLGWEEDVGFFATVAPPAAFGYATSADGTVWTFSRGHAPFEPVVGLDGALFLASGERVDAGVDADVPTEGGRLLVFDGGVRVWSSDSGETWVHDGSVWNEIGTGALDGLPGPPERLVLVGSRLFAMTEGVDGEQVTFVIDLD